MHSILTVAIEAARAAGQIIVAASKDISALQIEQKSLNDYVSEVDRSSERSITQVVTSAFPEHAIIGEEYGNAGTDDGEYTWIIDPLDGTTNFLRGIAHYAVSIAVMRDGRVEHAVVLDPAKDEQFTASRGKGAHLNGKPIQVSNIPGMSGALIATGVPFSGKNLAELGSFLHTMQGVLAKQTSGIRRLGAAALDLAYVAAGRYDGFWEANLQAWDIAAGALLVEEAGGRVADFNGADQHLQSGDIVAASPDIFQALVDVTTTTYQRYPVRPW
ncbi:MAG: inositol monophosphatase family protein [Pseudomonadota bacterium]